MEQVSVIAWFLVIFSLYIDPLYSRYTVTPDLQSVLTLAMHVDPVFFNFPNRSGSVGPHIKWPAMLPLHLT